MSLKSKIQALITAANAKTGESATDLTGAVQDLVDGYGQGGTPVINPLSVTANGTYTAPSGVDGYSPVTVNVPQGITPTGNINITDLNPTDVTNYATATVVDADLVAENIKKDVNILGVVGSFEGGGTEITLGMVCTDFSGGDHKPTKADLYCEGEIPYGMFALSYGFATAQAGDLTFHGKPTKLNAYAFYKVSDCYGLDTSKINSLPAYCFAATNWRSRANIELTEATSVSGSAQFYEASGIVNIAFPKLDTLPSNFMGRVTSMKTCQVGSIGYPVTSSHSGCFISDTQTDLTITAFCKGTYADTLLANIRSGATNATIIIKASENTTYNGTAYAAGETMITSNP